MGRTVSRIDLLGTIQVVDRGVLAEPGNIAAHLTPEGYLSIDGQIASVGVQEYGDGKSTWGELRMPEHVFADESLRTFAGKPITDDHPPEFVTIDNWAEHARGHNGSSIRPNGRSTHVLADMLITDAKLIKKIQDGKCQLSNGYTAVLVPSEGEVDGAPYSFVQTQIRGNHTAVVDVARGGPECRLQLTDRADAVSYQDATMYRSKPLARLTLTKARTLDAVLMLGDVPYPVPDDIAQQIVNELTAAPPVPAVPAGPAPAPAVAAPVPVPAAPAVAPAPVPPDAEGEEEEEEEDPMKSKEKGDSSEIEKLRATVDSLQSQLANATSTVGLDAKLELIENAKTVLGSEFKRGQDDASLMRAVVAKVHGDSSAISVNCKTGSADYLRAAYDAAIAAHSRATASALLGSAFRASVNDAGDDPLLAAIRKHHTGASA